jgi:hypothetical protein
LVIDVVLKKIITSCIKILKMRNVLIEFRNNNLQAFHHGWLYHLGFGTKSFEMMNFVR